MLSNRIRSRQDQTKTLTSREGAETALQILPPPPIELKRAVTVIEQPLPSNNSETSEKGRTKLEDAKKIIMQSLKRDFYKN
jgi:hypothetical protein